MTIKNKRKRKYTKKEFTYKSLIQCLTNFELRMSYKIAFDEDDDSFYFIKDKENYFYEVNEQQYKLLDGDSPNTLGHCLYGVNIELNKNISKPRLTSLSNNRDQKINEILNETKST